MKQEKVKFYGLFDAALMPKIWLNLEVWQLNFEPLYQGDYQPIEEAIPYLIELDKSADDSAVKELSTSKDYCSALFIRSSASLKELVKKLAFFYHVKNAQNESCLRHFFDLRLFKQFLSTLPPAYCAYLFDNQTVFGYLEPESDFYHVIIYQHNQICWLQKEQPEFLAHFIEGN